MYSMDILLFTGQKIVQIIAVVTVIASAAIFGFVLIAVMFIFLRSKFQIIHIYS